MPTVRPHGKKFGLEFRLNAKRQNVPIPSQLPETFHEQVRQHADRLIERMTEERQRFCNGLRSSVSKLLSAFAEYSPAGWHQLAKFDQSLESRFSTNVI